ncbi:galactosylceramide sulfotransferase-like isoform X2 [Palaemon carinicauda]|uniref:galactosylceramide sulfotransferase-like isoform X2 n=1 Tax=Palaemon carinicauda TaxID=392227 RepID=UPI0035B60AAE
MMKAPVNLSRVTIKRISLFLILIGSGSYLHFIGGLTYSRTKLFSPSNQMIVEPERPTGYIKPTFEDIIDQDSYNLPGLIKDQTQETCSAVTNIAFLKTHKCASSAIQNILFRYGFQHNLLFALPKTGNYFGIGTPFHDSMVRDTPWFKLGLNIFAIHTKWNQEKVMNVMPKDSVYITIVREPTALFESLYTFLKMTKVKKADKDFDLVMVAERMEESLILMSRLLCWNITDVLVLKVNARMSNFKKKINKKTKRLLRRKLAPDYLIYNFFSQKFDKLVERYGRKRMAEDVSKLRKATEKFRTECGIQERTSKDLNGVNKPWSEQVSGYQSQSKSIVCQLMSFSEIPFMHGLRERQMSLYNKTFGSKEIGGK